MEEKPSAVLREDTQSTRHRIFQDLGVEVDWVTRELWPRFKSMHEETWVLPQWVDTDCPQASLPRGVSDEVLERARKSLVSTQVREQILHDEFQADNCVRLLPHPTTADGDCLSHAVCNAMWGISDRISLFRHLMQVLVCIET